MLFIPSNEARFLLQDGTIVKYLPPTAKDFPKEAIDSEIGVIHRRAVIGVAYNSSIINFAEAPESLEDLVHPKYKGKIAMPDPTQHSTTAQWLASLYKILGKDENRTNLFATWLPSNLFFSNPLRPPRSESAQGRHPLELRN